MLAPAARRRWQRERPPNKGLKINSHAARWPLGGDAQKVTLPPAVGCPRQARIVMNGPQLAPMGQADITEHSDLAGEGGGGGGSGLCLPAARRPPPACQARAAKPKRWPSAG